MEETKANLLNMIVHDLRAPLSSILGGLQVVSDSKESTLDPEDADLLESGLRDGWYLNEMIASLLDISRLEESRMPISIECVSVVPLVNEAVATVSGIRRDLTFDVEPLEASLDEVSCDASLMRRVLTNLLSNSAKFSPQGATVSVIWKVDDPDRLGIGVRDEGPGIPEDYRDKIFEKFGQVGKDRRSFQYSSGLGLAFCSTAMAEQSGAIELDTEEGKGSTFWLILPTS